MQTIQLNTDKQTISYRKTGAGPVAILIHGFPEDGSLWEPVVPVLASTFTVICPDIPGAGSSTLSQVQNQTIESLSGFLNDIYRQEDIAEAVLVGHSMGGYLALAFLESYPEKVKGISLVHSTATADSEEKKEMRRKAVALISKGGKEAFVKGMIPNLFSDAFKTDQPAQLERQVQRGLKLRSESMAAFYTAMMNRQDRTGNLKDNAKPVQWVIGKEDSVVPLNLALSQARLSQTTFVSLYENCGHMSMLEQPEKLSGDLRDFLAYCYNR